MARSKNIDKLLRDWPFDPRNLSVRFVSCRDGRLVIQMRIEMGLLQLETEGRPDGSRPHGYDTYLAYLRNLVRLQGDAFELDEDDCVEADREFLQYYHRRVCWLRLQDFPRAIEDADHTLELMDFCKKFSPDDEWTLSHEQYRPFVLFHRTQAAALVGLQDNGPEAAVEALNQGLQRLRDVYQEYQAEEQFEEDELVTRLREMREALRREYDVGRTLRERLADAVAQEKYELAAKLRDELARRRD